MAFQTNRFWNALANTSASADPGHAWSLVNLAPKYWVIGTDPTLLSADSNKKKEAVTPQTVFGRLKMC